jgi:hypothetical protein
MEIVSFNNSISESDKSSDGRTSIDFDDRYIPLMIKGLIIEDFAFNMHLTYELTKVGELILNKLNTK